jgi:hypothetical protein
MTAQRFMYYVPWHITTGTVIASGLGYNGKDKHGGDDFDRIYSIDTFGVELGNSSAAMMVVRLSNCLDLIVVESHDPLVAEALRILQIV